MTVPSGIFRVPRREPETTEVRRYPYPQVDGERSGTNNLPVVVEHAREIGGVESVFERGPEEAVPSVTVREDPVAESRSEGARLIEEVEVEAVLPIDVC